MSLKEYTELNQAKHKRWLDFRWMLQDLTHHGINDIIEVMRLRELANNLITDYRTTARNEIRKGKGWNTLTEEEKDRLIRYWANEKARIEKGYLDTAEEIEKEGKEFFNEIELAKFHEERGKIKCPCYSCEGAKEAKAKIAKEQKQLEKQEVEKERGNCLMCGKIRMLDEEGVCKSCSAEYE